MSLTKGELTTEAYALIGVSAGLDASQLAQGVKLCERMVGSWGAGYISGYIIATPPALPLPTDDSGVLQSAEDAIITNLALSIASVNGIMAGTQLSLDAKKGKSKLISTTAPSIAKDPFMPMGAGYRRYGDNFNTYQNADKDAT